MRAKSKIFNFVLVLRHPGIEPGPHRWQRRILTTELMALRGMVEDDGVDSMAKILDPFHGKILGIESMAKYCGSDPFHSIHGGCGSASLATSYPCHPSYFSIPIPILRWIPCDGKQWLGWIPWQKSGMESMAKYWGSNPSTPSSSSSSILRSRYSSAGRASD